MTKLFDVAALVVFISFMASIAYGSYTYIKRVDNMVEQYRIELLNK